jgi:hypothetical protein
MVFSPARYEYALNIYDDKGRLIQIKAKNSTGGTDIITTQFSWAGQALITVQKQQKAGINAQTSVVVSKISYDDLGRVTKTEKKVGHTLVNNNALSDFVAVVTLEYDALWQVKKKAIGNKKDPVTNLYYTSRQPLQELTFYYNIRGWLLGMNRDFIKDEGAAQFGFELAYDKQKSVVDNYTSNTFVKSQLTGNIAGMIWKSAGDSEKRKYDFDYDAANPLLRADFTQNNGGWNTSAGVDFSMEMGDGTRPILAYDANGNMLAMQQKGLKLDGSSLIDQLTYSYEAGSNKLKQVAAGGNVNLRLTLNNDGTGNNS